MGPSIETPLTKLFGIKHPILLAGMNVAAGPELAAAVTNAGGLGVIGGVGYTPKFLKAQIEILKSQLNDKNAPFGIDLLLPQVGGNARKTNYDYTNGQLVELVDVIIEEKAGLFVCAIGVPPKWAVEKLHAAKIPVMNMIGHPKHVARACAVGADIICAQGGEGGGHTGSVPFITLIPKCAEEVQKYISPLSGKPVQLVAAGGIYNGRGLAAALMYGASGVWVGTRFVCAKEAGAPKSHQEAIIKSGYDDTIRTIIFTGRPLRVRKNEYILNWEENRKDEIKKLTSQGIIPVMWDIENNEKKEELDEINLRPHLMGQVAAVINDIKPAKEIIDEMIQEAVERLTSKTIIAKL